MANMEVWTLYPYTISTRFGTHVDLVADLALQPSDIEKGRVLRAAQRG